MKRANKSSTARAVGRISRTGCSAVTALQSAFLNLKSAKRDCEAAADFLGAFDKDEALIWANNAIRQIESAKAKILESQNAAGQTPAAQEKRHDA